MHAETQLAYGGLKKETVERLRLLGKQYDGKPGEKPKGRSQRLPIAGTRLIREWQGAEHSVTVRGDDGWLVVTACGTKPVDAVHSTEFATLGRFADVEEGNAKAPPAGDAIVLTLPGLSRIQKNAAR